MILKRNTVKKSIFSKSHESSNFRQSIVFSLQINENETVSFIAIKQYEFFVCIYTEDDFLIEKLSLILIKNKCLPWYVLFYNTNYFRIISPPHKAAFCFEFYADSAIILLWLAHQDDSGLVYSSSFKRFLSEICFSRKPQQSRFFPINVLVFLSEQSKYKVQLRLHHDFLSDILQLFASVLVNFF